uniref:Serine/arginine-rich splicing factor 9 n=2 Tax=Cyprinidae TaxID=7953 RepID=A0A9J7XX32_CYPCA
MSDGRIYVGNLPMDVQERDIEDLFYKYGKIRDIELKNNRGTIPFAFVRFEDPRDAEDAVFGRNGYGFGDNKLRVEYPRSSGSKFSGPPGGGGGGGGGPRGRFGPPSRRSEFRVIVTGLPPTGSWQDLKDHMREAGDVCFADVQRDGEGVVEFLRREDMEYALRRLDSTEFRSHQGETSYIRVMEERGTSWGRSETTAERNTQAFSKAACSTHCTYTGLSSASAYIRADGGVLARLAVHAGAGRTFGQSCGVLLLLPLTHDGLTSQPLAHGLLVTRSNLLVHLRRRAGLRSSCVRLVSGSSSDLCSPLCAL